MCFGEYEGIWIGVRGCERGVMGCEIKVGWKNEMRGGVKIDMKVGIGIENDLG